MSDERPPIVDSETIPDELTERAQWLFWNASSDSPRKPLPSPNANYGASWTDPDEWHDFETALQQAQDVPTAGIGYVFANSNDDYARGLYGALDLDSVVGDDGRPADWVPSMQPFFDHDVYIEWSPSGEGFRIPIVGFEPPEWWDNTHTDNEHEGAEAYGSKFMTMTGDKVRGAGDTVAEHADWIDAWLRECYKSLTGEDPLADSNDEYDDDHAASRPSNDEEWMDEDVAKDALDHIDPDSQYETWRDIGMALVNAFGQSRGSALFEDWSRGGSKWDRDAEKQAERISKDASNYNYDRGTIVHHAKSGGWDASSAARDASTAAPAPTKTPEGNADTESTGTETYSPIEAFSGGLNIAKQTKDGETYYEKLTNFWIDVDAVLKRDDGRMEYLLTIDPIAESDYQVAVEPRVFNDKRQFESKICGEGLSATFDGSPSDLNRLKEYVAQQDAPVRRGTEHIGLHDDEWVVPDGTLTADGWTEEPGTVFESAKTPLATKCSLTPEVGDEYDSETVREILRLLPKTRLTERFLPALGWFYAATTRPYIQRWEGEFNILAVTGDSGAGKTATLEALWQCFGVNGDLLRADGTTFPKMRALATSNALPVVFDEYKPADMSQYAVDSFHSLLRTSTRGGIEEKGRPDGSVIGHKLLAPTVISGEQALRGTAEERRTLQTSFSRQASVGGTPESQAFARLTGGDIDGEVTDGYDLSQHSIAYYQWLLNQAESDLREIWTTAREDAVSAVAEVGVSGLDDMRLQAIQTLIYGCRIYQSFAADMGLERVDIPVRSREIDRAVKYILNERTATNHVSNLDRFLELACRAAAAGYLERGEHFDFVHEDNPDEELRIKLSLVYDQLRRYARDHDIQDADLLSSSTDYGARISDAEEDDDSYVTAKSKQTPGLNRCVAIATNTAEAQIDGFETSMFRPGVDGQEQTDTEDNEYSYCLADLDPSYGQPVTFTATATSILDPKPWLQAEGILQDDSGVLRFIARGQTNPAADVEEGERVEIRDAMVSTNDDGATVVELIDGLTTITTAATASQQSGLQESATTDGGKSVNQQIDDHVRAQKSGNVITIAQVAGATGVSPDDVQHRIEKLVKENGLLAEDADGYEVL